MKKIYADEPGFEAALQPLYDRPGYPPEIEAQAAAIIDEVRRDGDAALVKFAEKFDHVALTPEHFRVTDAGGAFPSGDPFLVGDENIYVSFDQIVVFACFVDFYRDTQVPLFRTLDALLVNVP